MFAAEDQPQGPARTAPPAVRNPLHLGYGRFLQTDPLGYDDGLNWYDYVGGDPVNFTDPTGLKGTGCTGAADEVCGKPLPPVDFSGWADRLVRVAGVGGLDPLASDADGPDIIVVAKSKPQKTNPACTSGRYTLGGQFSVTGFLASFGVSGNVEVGVALPTRLSNSWNPFAGVQIYARAQGLGLAGLGFFAGSGVSGVGGINGSPLTTGVQTSVVAQGGFAAPGGGEASISLDGSGASASGGPRAGMGGYLAGGAGKTATLATTPLGCPR